ASDQSIGFSRLDMIGVLIDSLERDRSHSDGNESKGVTPTSDRRALLPASREFGRVYGCDLGERMNDLEEQSAGLHGSPRLFGRALEDGGNIHLHRRIAPAVPPVLTSPIAPAGRAPPGHRLRCRRS